MPEMTLTTPPVILQITLSASSLTYKSPSGESARPYGLLNPEAYVRTGRVSVEDAVKWRCVEFTGGQFANDASIHHSLRPGSAISDADVAETTCTVAAAAPSTDVKIV